MKAIEIRGLEKHFSRFNLGPLDLTVPQGAVYGLIGPNGAGKTTTLDLVLGLGREDAGSIKVLGLDHRRDEVAMKQQVGYASPEVLFNAWGRVHKLIRFVRGFYPSWDDAYCGRLLDALHIGLDERIAALSFGSRVKLGLILALAWHPKILILDEPTAGLDAVSKQQIFSELLGAVQDEERTVLISSHSLSDLERFADHIGMIKNGRLLLEGPTSEVVARFQLVDFVTDDERDFAPSPGIFVRRHERNRWQAVVDTRQNPLDSIGARGARQISTSPITLERSRRGALRGVNMKRIVLDCLRRWAWLYAAGFVLALGLDIMGAYVPSFGVFTPYFLAPMLGPLFVLGFDLMRGVAGVTVALPISARKVGVSYWIVGVCVPAVLLSLALVAASIIAHLFSAPIPSGWEQVVWTFIISFLICGCIFFVLTFVKVGPQEGFWNNAAAGLAGASWGVGAFAGIGVKYLLDFRKHDAVTITSVACVALVFTVLGFLRCDEVVRSRARNRLAQRGSPRRSAVVASATESTTSGLSGFPYLFLESIKFSLGMALGLILFGFLLRTFVPVNSPFIQYTLLACALLPSLRYFVGLRHMRALPISLDGLAVILFLLPLVNFSLCLAMMFLVEAITATGTFYAVPATLWFTAAITSVSNAMLVRFGPKSLPIAFAIGIMSLFAIPTGLVLACYVASAALMIAAFAILRSSLRCSNLYRLPAGTCSVG